MKTHVTYFTRRRVVSSRSRLVPSRSITVPPALTLLPAAKQHALIQAIEGPETGSL